MNLLYKTFSTNTIYPFHSGNKWDEVYNLVNKSADEIWKINQKFIDNQKALGKEFYLSHDPSVATGFYYREVQYLTKPVNQGGAWRNSFKSRK